MTKYLDKSFSSPANSKAYKDGWERVFGKKEDKVWAVAEIVRQEDTVDILAVWFFEEDGSLSESVQEVSYDPRDLAPIDPATGKATGFHPIGTRFHLVGPADGSVLKPVLIEDE